MKPVPVRSYEELEGAAGREVFFRPQRYKAQDLDPVQIVVRVALGGEFRALPWYDLAQGGLAVHWPAEWPEPDLDQELAVEILAQDRLLHAAEARVAVVRTAAEQALTGLALLGSPLDIEALLHLRDLCRWQPTEGSDLSLSHANWKVSGHEEFRAAVGTFRLFLEDARQQFGALERALPWSVIHGEGPGPDNRSAVHYQARPGWLGDGNQARSALVDRLIAEFVPEVLGHFAAIDTAMRSASREDNARLKRFSVRHLHELLLPAPLLHRAWSKPLGYPGDFECMNYMYFRPFEGQDLYAKAVHLAACASPPAAAVRARKDLVKAEILRALHNPPADRPLRVVSIAAGPSQEVFELLAETAELPHPIEIVLFDQDRVALAFAQRRLAPLVERHGRRLKLVVLHDSIRRLIHDASLFANLGPFDLLFSSGLFDYLRHDLAAQLVGIFYSHLVDGGRALIGNMAPHNPARWVFEHHLDWTLLYRTPQQMLDFGRDGAPQAQLSVVMDATELNPYLVVQRT